MADEEKFIADYETGERLLSPFVLIALPGSKKHPVPLNTKTLDFYNDGMMDIIDLIVQNSESLLSYELLIGGEALYFVFSAFSKYDISNPPNLLSSSKPTICNFIGYFTSSAIENGLIKVHKYFNSPEIESYSWGMELERSDRTSKKGQLEIKTEESFPEAEDNIPF
ncbi:MAG TPA: hypothetical protein VI815_00275 [Candidatus Nanoarchaeia archaeon]|nr:hypothetical protein [Candidatus Nanoarchaeia archaeon]